MPDRMRRYLSDDPSFLEPLHGIDSRVNRDFSEKDKVQHKSNLPKKVRFEGSFPGLLVRWESLYTILESVSLFLQLGPLL